MNSDAFDQLVADALDGLPEEFQELMNNVEVVVADWPSSYQLASVGVRFRTNLLGLYQGIPLTRRSVYYGLVAPDKITIFQYPIERLCATEDEIRQRVQDVVIHELGHHFGIGETRLRELEAQRDEKRRQEGK
ncbi:MAG: metallopeptidase family protein [Ardenticatenaceae bacterium]